MKKAIYLFKKIFFFDLELYFSVGFNLTFFFFLEDFYFYYSIKNITRTESSTRIATSESQKTGLRSIFPDNIKGKFIVYIRIVLSCRTFFFFFFFFFGWVNFVSCVRKKVHLLLLQIRFGQSRKAFDLISWPCLQFSRDLVSAFRDSWNICTQFWSWKFGVDVYLPLKSEKLIPCLFVFFTTHYAK